MAAECDGALGQEFERRRHRDRRRVVGVVDERRSVGRLEQCHAVRRVAALRKGRRDVVERDPQVLSHDRRREGVRHEVASRGGGVEPSLSPRSFQGERGAIHAMGLDRGGAHVGARAEAEGADRGRRYVAHGRDEGIIRVQHGQPVRRERCRQLCLGARDRLDAPCSLQVGRVHGEDHSHLWAGDLGEAGDLPLGVHAHLEHRHLVPRLEVEERHRQAGLAVEVALVAQDAQGSGQDVGHDLLGDRLAGRAGDADHPHARPAPPPGGDLLEREERVWHLHDRHSLPGSVDRTVDQRDRRAASDRLRHEAMTVGSLAPQRDEAAAGDDVAGVNSGGGEGGDPCRPDEVAAGGGQEVYEPDRRWHAAPWRGFRRV